MKRIIAETLRLTNWQRTAETDEYTPCDMEVEIVITIDSRFLEKLARKALLNKRGITTLASGKIVATAVRH